MKIAVINGSPKGKRSVTMQYIYFLEKQYPDYEFVFLDAAQKIDYFEKNIGQDNDPFAQAITQISESQIVLWAFPLYFLLVNSGYKRFIELIFENNYTEKFKGKYCGILSTSIHYFDYTAVNYIHGIADDLGMNVVDEILPEMQDLMDKKFQESLKAYFEGIIQAYREKLRFSVKYSPFSMEYEIMDFRNSVVMDDKNQKIAVICDAGDKTTITMAEKLKDLFPDSYYFDLSSIKFGKCLGCLKCGFDNVCAYEENNGKDEFISCHRKMIKENSILIFCLTMKDRYFSYLWQRYLERTFYRTHQPTIKGKQLIFLVNGPLSKNENARTILKGYAETMKGNIIAIESYEKSGANVSFRDNSRNFEKTLEYVCNKAIEYSQRKIYRPSSFLGIAGMKIFRDDIYAGLRAVFQRDHQYYRKHKIYNFPDKNFFKKIMYAAQYYALKIPFIKKQARENMSNFMLIPFKKIIGNKKNN